jgi:hypothetical protein
MEMPSNDKMKRGSMDNDLAINRVRYAKEPRHSLVNVRRNVTHYFDKTDYTSSDSEMVCKLISSTDFINPGNCYLRMTLRVQLAAGGNPASVYQLNRFSGALATWDQLYISSRDGTQLELIQNLAEFSRTKLWNDCQPPYIKNYAQVFGVEYTDNESALLVGDKTGQNLGTTDVQVLIPLCFLSGIFHPDNDLIPPQLSSNMRIRLTLNRIENILFRRNDGGAESVVLSIKNPVIVTDNFTMTQKVQRAVLENSGVNRDGLIYSYDTAFGQQSSTPNGTVNEEINKSVGLANKLDWIYQDHTNDALPAGYNTYLATCSDGTTYMDSVEQRVRLGDLYWHVTNLTTTDPQQSVEFYQNTVYSCDKTDCRAPAYSIPYNIWRSAADATAAPAPAGATDKYLNYNSQTLQRSNILSASGLPINAGRACVITQRFQTSDSDRVIKSHLHYTVALNVFPTNVVVNI